MRYIPNRARRKRFLFTSGVVAAIVLAGGAVIAYAAYPSNSVTVMTGCLTTSGTSAGNLGSIAVGLSPAKSCGSNQALVHLSGGTITRVTAGTGVTVNGPGTGGSGYIDNGSATIGLDSAYTLPQSCNAGNLSGWSGSNWQCYAAGNGLSVDNGGKTIGVTGSYQLPQSCSDKQVTKWDQTSNSWKCADDNSYSAGTGLDLSNSNELSLKSGYQLPQDCTSGKVVASDGNGGWTCQNSVGSLSSYTNQWTASVEDFYSSNTAYANCNYGDIRTGGGFNTDNVDIKGSGPNGTTGWFARADGGLEGGSVTVYVNCLHIG